MHPALLTLALAIFSVIALVLGALSLLLPISLRLQTALLDFLTHSWSLFFIAGSTLIVLGISLTALVVVRLRCRYLTLIGEDAVVTVDEGVINSYVSEYWQRRFPSAECTSKVRLKGHKVVVTVHLPFVDPQHQGSLLSESKRELEQLFADSFGCHYPLNLCVSFGD